MKVTGVMVAEVKVAALVVRRGDSGGRGGGGRMGGGVGSLMVSGLELVHPRSVLDQVRGVWTSQDRRPEEHTMTSELECG
jgi:hypothetical protein